MLFGFGWHFLIFRNPKQFNMKNLKFLAIILLIGMIAACEKEGPAGPQGTSGINGTNGADGNANVAVYGFGSVTLTTAHFEQSFLLPISAEKVDSSLIMPYYFQYDFWYPVGTVGYSGDFSTRYYMSPGTPTSLLFAQIRNADGSMYTGTDVVWDSVRVFVIPANVFYTSLDQQVDYDDYQSVTRYFEHK